jgi:hypothetical protein
VVGSLGNTRIVPSTPKGADKRRLIGREAAQAQLRLPALCAA